MEASEQVRIATRAWELLGEILTDKYGEEYGAIIKYRVTPKEEEQKNDKSA